MCHIDITQRWLVTTLYFATTDPHFKKWISGSQLLCPRGPFFCFYNPFVPFPFIQFTRWWPSPQVSWVMCQVELPHLMWHAPGFPCTVHGNWIFLWLWCLQLNDKKWEIKKIIWSQVALWYLYMFTQRIKGIGQLWWKLISTHWKAFYYSNDQILQMCFNSILIIWKGKVLHGNS